MRPARSPLRVVRPVGERCAAGRIRSGCPRCVISAGRFRSGGGDRSPSTHGLPLDLPERRAAHGHRRARDRAWPQAARAGPPAAGRVRPAAAGAQRHRRGAGPARPVRRRPPRGPGVDPARPARHRRLTRRPAPLPPDDLRPGRRRPPHQLGHGRVDVLGYSWGGALAQQLAVIRPAQVRRLVLVATTTGALAVPPSPRVLGRLLAPRWPQRPGGRAGRRHRALRRHAAHPPGTRGGHAGGDRRQPAPQPARLRPAARRDRRLDEPARAPPDPGAHAGDRGRRRPDHPVAQRHDPGPRDPRRQGAPPPGRAPGDHHRGAGAGRRDGGVPRRPSSSGHGLCRRRAASTRRSSCTPGTPGTPAWASGSPGRSRRTAPRPGCPAPRSRRSSP